MNTNLQRVLKYALPVVIILAAVFAARTLIKSKAKPERTEAVNHGILVELATAAHEKKQIDLSAQGTVMASEKVTLQPQVSGSVTWVSDALVSGGLVKKGDPLLKIDRRDYEIILAQRKSAMDQAEAQLSIEQGQQRVALREWELFKERAGNGNDDASLALRAPQQRIAEVNVESAKAGQDKARLHLSRTVIRAPFNGYVQSENVEIGQTVTPQSQLATIVGTDAYWVQVSVPVDKLSFIEIPGMNATTGAVATVNQQNGAERVTRKGQVLRLLPEVDPIGRMARVLARIEDPMNLTAPEGERGVPLMMGTIVTVDIHGRSEAEVAVVPRAAVHDGDHVWAFQDNRLDLRQVEVVWGDEDTVWIGTGLKPGEQYVTSRISTPVQGMKLRTESEPAVKEAAPKKEKP